MIPPIRAIFVASVFVGIVGCGRMQTTEPPKKVLVGGDRPVSAVRLTDSVLLSIQEPVVEWRFTDDGFVVHAGKSPLPSDLADVLFGPGATVDMVEGKWAHDIGNGTLLLTEIRSGDKKGVEKATLPVAPAGAVRANLGTRQYNLIPRSHFEKPEE
jgi:hypothetical protein